MVEHKPQPSHTVNTLVSDLIEINQSGTNGIATDERNTSERRSLTVDYEFEFSILARKPQAQWDFLRPPVSFPRL
jgi:hypothetical protein